MAQFIYIWGTEHTFLTDNVPTLTSDWLILIPGINPITTVNTTQKLWHNYSGCLQKKYRMVMFYFLLSIIIHSAKL